MKVKIDFTIHQRVYCARVTQRVAESYKSDVTAIINDDRAMLAHAFNLSAIELAFIDWKLNKQNEAVISLLPSQVVTLYLLTNSKKVLEALSESDLFTAREVNYKLFMQIVNQ